MLVVENQSLGGARALVAPESLPTWEDRGWVAVGPCSDPARRPILVDAEQAVSDEALAAHVAEAMDAARPGDSAAVEAAIEAASDVIDMAVEDAIRAAEPDPEPAAPADEPDPITKEQ